MSSYTIYNSLYIYIVFINYLNRIYIIQLGYPSPIVNKHVWMMRRLRSENHSCSFQLFGYDFMVRNYFFTMSMSPFLVPLSLRLGLACWIADWKSPWVTKWDVSTAITKLFPHSTATWPVGQKKANLVGAGGWRVQCLAIGSKCASGGWCLAGYGDLMG